MSEVTCTCDRPGFCPAHARQVSRTGAAIWRRGDAESIQAYFRVGPSTRPPRPPVPAAQATPPRGRGPGGSPRSATRSTAKVAAANRPPCAFLGSPVVGPDGRQVTRVCGPCGGKVRAKVFECEHPNHRDTTVKECERCRDYQPGGGTEGATGMWNDHRTRRDRGGLPVDMVVPSDRRPQIFRGGVLQVMVTRACDLACHGCTAGSNLVSKPAVMTPEQFEEAVASLEGYPGVIGCFGGNPTTSRYFEDYCRILRARVPFEQRGLWCNNLLGKGALARITFNPKVSNVNVHLSRDAYDEFARDWPEAIAARREHVDRGLREDSRHGTPYVSMVDLGVPEDERWGLIGACDINRNWSAMIGLVRGELRAFLCEIQGHMAALHGDNPDWAGTGAPMPDVGLAVEPGWWRRPLADFEGQVRTFCHHCAIPLRREGQLAIGGEREEYSPTHAHLMRPKVRTRPTELVTLGPAPGRPGRPGRPATEYLAGATPGYNGA